MIDSENNKDWFVGGVKKWLQSIKMIINKWLLKRRIKRLDMLYMSKVQNVKLRDGLTFKQHQAINDLFGKYVKIRHCSHLFYAQKTGVFCKEYIPDSIFSYMIDPYYNDWRMASYIDNKCYYPYLFRNEPLPKMIVYRLGGFWYDAHGEIINLSKAVGLSMAVGECFVKKATNSWGGLGVFYFRASDGDGQKLLEIIKSISGDLVIQERIMQSETLSRINSNCINTIRLMSMLKQDGTVKIYSSVLRMGVGNSKVDNASSGGISVGIQDDGRLKAVAYSNIGIRYTEHPSSHAQFSDFVIPNYVEMRNMVSRLHPKFPHFKLISWDIAVDQEDKPVLLEVNLCDGELDFHQLNNGPIFGEDTEMILSEVFSKKK